LKRRPLKHGDTVRGIAVAIASAFVFCAMPASAQLNCNPGVEFYQDGPLKQCNLNGDHRLYTQRGDVIVCANGHPLVQFPDGRLQSCTVNDTSVIAGERCEAPAWVELAPDGSLLSCRKT
jgi:hypothetical protein